jgi:hypothetical protein
LNICFIDRYIFPKSTEKIKVASDMLAASEIAVSDSRGGLFSAFTGDQGCLVGQEN